MSDHILIRGVTYIAISITKVLESASFVALIHGWPSPIKALKHSN